MQITQAQLNIAIKEAMSAVVRLAELKEKKRLKSSEVQELYGISKARLNKMRINGEGPKYSKPVACNADKDTSTATVFYTHTAIEEWLAEHEVHPI